MRYIAFMIAGFFAGIAGGLYALNFEIVTDEVVGAQRSGAYLLFTFLGGSLFFFGPIIGAVLMVFAMVMLSELTKAWLLYLGLLFLFMVMYAPGGFASLLMMNMRLAAYGMLKRLWGVYAAMAVTATLVILPFAAVVEMVYHIKLNEALGPVMRFAGMDLDTRSSTTWGLTLLMLAVGVGLFELVRRRFSRLWNQIQEDIEAQLARTPAL